MASTLSPSTQDSLNGLNARMELNMVEVLAKSYGEGFVKAAEALEAKPQVTRDDSKLLREDVARLTRPIQDYNKALAGKVDEIVRDSFAAGKSDTEVAKILRTRIPEILNNEPITIQRPGKRPVSFTADEYADIVANVVPYAVRNEGYIRGLKEAGADGWISVATGDERMCPMCGEKNGQVYGWEDPKPPYHPGPCRCRPVAYFRPKTKDDLAESERIKAKALEEPWDKPGIPADSADEVAEQLIDDIIPVKMAYPGSTIERPKLERKTIGIDESEVVDKYVTKYMSGDPSVFNRVNNQDMFLSEIVKSNEFDGLPKLVSPGELDKIVAEGHRELWRGVSQKDYADKFKSGEYFAGTGIFGDGTYTAYGPRQIDIVSGYTGREDGCLIRMAIDKDAKIIDIDDLKIEMSNYLNELSAESAKKLSAIPKGDKDLYQRFSAENTVKMIVANDPGKFAALKGYDAINIPSENYMVVINRKALYVHQESISIEQLNTLKSIERIESNISDMDRKIKDLELDKSQRATPKIEVLRDMQSDSQKEIAELRKKLW